ncbi:MAG: pyridoxamine 5'-phosphate oxidase [Myxococcota bacterium]
MTEDLQHDPIAWFTAWLDDAYRDDPLANACALATAEPDGAPSVRMVLLKGHDRRGFVFFTNLGSRKGRELAANPRAALCFHVRDRRRQVRVAGPVTPVEPYEADAYFATRARDSQLAAWASRQSQPMASREVLEAAVAEVTARFEGQTVPRPPFWSGFRIAPERIEFWEDVPYRLHRRWAFAPEGDGWAVHELQP